MSTIRETDNTQKDYLKTTSLKIPASLHQKVKEIAVKERRKLQDIVAEKLEEYVKTHGDGNPAFTLDQFNDPDFHITPAVGRNYDAWQKYYTTIKTEKEYREIDRQLNMIIGIHNQSLQKFHPSD